MEIAEIIRLHGLWLEGKEDGKRADLSGANLYGANLTRANLNGADLRWANLTDANLVGSDLSGADLRGADLTRANLTRANLRGSDLTRADLYGANLYGAYLSGANLPPLKTVLPEGAFTAYKKVFGNAILTLLIPADAARTGSLVGKKCRADRAKVVSASVEGLSFQSLYDHSFTYTVGEVVFEPNYDSDTRVECTDGIHFFMTREEAEAFTF